MQYAPWMSKVLLEERFARKLLAGLAKSYKVRTPRLVIEEYSYPGYWAGANEIETPRQEVTFETLVHEFAHHLDFLINGHRDKSHWHDKEFRKRLSKLRDKAYKIQENIGAHIA